ncbi:MAG TPA: AbrB/MazE/SpoVT family DNA-binding domain-containing protein, partial [Clostridia bacterium]|nr:AbrB/MazE/SpoVT family DNA-binding domain-containing protein [Clostridia bacterium]
CITLNGGLEMDEFKNVRLIDELGRIVIPAEDRNALNWAEKTPVEISVNAAEQEVILKRHTRTCTFCAETANLKVFQNKPICPACQKAIANL